MRKLTPEEIASLETQGCLADDWEMITVSEQTDLSLLHNLTFRGKVSLGPLKKGNGYVGIYNATLKDCVVGSDVFIHNVHGEISGYRIGEKVCIENVGRIIGHESASCGIGMEVNVLDETGSRAVRIYPGINAQIASLRAFFPHKTEEMWSSLEEYPSGYPEIGARAQIKDTQIIYDVNIARDVSIEGAIKLKNGTIINNASRGTSKAYIGVAVKAENFILEDGILDSGCEITNCYIGQNSHVSRSFSAHDCLIFSNCVLENGEACAFFAGPYTVSMHKGSLLIGAQSSFMNAGSATNFSNHLYKLGPVHWGILQRGCKTASGSYMMWGGRIGAFSLLSGSHKHHPDTARFPFSYLFSDNRGKTIVIPGKMLTSSGLMRDEHKWPMRDLREEYHLPMLDNIIQHSLNPYTVGEMMDSVDLLRSLLAELPKNNNDNIIVDGLIIPVKAAQEGIVLYELAIKHYFHIKTKELNISEYESREGKWTDLCGQIMPVTTLKRALKSESAAEAIEILNEAFEYYPEAELAWICWRFDTTWLMRMKDSSEASKEFIRRRDTDRSRYIEFLNSENSRYIL